MTIELTQLVSGSNVRRCLLGLLHGSTAAAMVPGSQVARHDHSERENRTGRFPKDTGI